VDSYCYIVSAAVPEPVTEILQIPNEFIGASGFQVSVVARFSIAKFKVQSILFGRPRKKLKAVSIDRFAEWLKNKTTVIKM